MRRQARKGLKKKRLKETYLNFKYEGLHVFYKLWKQEGLNSTSMNTIFHILRILFCNLQSESWNVNVSQNSFVFVFMDSKVPYSFFACIYIYFFVISLFNFSKRMLVLDSNHMNTCILCSELNQPLLKKLLICF